MTRKQYALINTVSGMTSGHPFKIMGFETAEAAEAHRDGIVAQANPEYAKTLVPVEVFVEERSGDSTLYTMSGHSALARRVRATQQVETHWVVEVDGKPLLGKFYQRNEAEAYARPALAYAAALG